METYLGPFNHSGMYMIINTKSNPLRDDCPESDPNSYWAQISDYTMLGGESKCRICRRGEKRHMEDAPCREVWLLFHGPYIVCMIRLGKFSQTIVTKSCILSSRVQ